jgi:hypothetical protein
MFSPASVLLAYSKWVPTGVFTMINGIRPQTPSKVITLYVRDNPVESILLRSQDPSSSNQGEIQEMVHGILDAVG